MPKHNVLNQTTKGARLRSRLAMNKRKRYDLIKNELVSRTKCTKSRTREHRAKPINSARQIACENCDQILGVLTEEQANMGRCEK